MKSSPISRNSIPRLATAVSMWLRVNSSTEISFFQMRIRKFLQIRAAQTIAIGAENDALISDSRAAPMCASYPHEPDATLDCRLRRLAGGAAGRTRHVGSRPVAERRAARLGNFRALREGV